MVLYVPLDPTVIDPEGGVDAASVLVRKWSANARWNREGFHMVLRIFCGCFENSGVEEEKPRELCASNGFIGRGQFLTTSLREVLVRGQTPRREFYMNGPCRQMFKR